MAPRTTRSMAGLTTDEVIKCLKDGSRDMTQVIYRQIPEKDIFGPDATLRGEALYRINYCGQAFCNAVGSSKGNTWGDDFRHISHQPEHDHLIWCAGTDQLFRCRVALTYANWTGCKKVANEGTIYTVKALCDMFGVPVPKNQSDLRVTVTKRKGYYAYDKVERYTEAHKNGLTEFGHAPLTGSVKLVDDINAAWVSFIHTWQNGQEQIMALPQLYLTGLRR
jgi:hypothetical protein